MPRVALHTLGCKVNQYETQKLAEEFQSKGFEVVDFRERADAYVINSCTVTQTADSKSRLAVRSALLRNPKAAVVITGCYAETSPDEAGTIQGISEVVGNSEKHLIVQRVVDMLRASNWSADHYNVETSPIRKSGRRTRALLKVQDGCDQFCAYCAVPLARPIMWSRPLEEVIHEASDLADKGYKEIVLTGIRLGRYADSGATLTDLLNRLASISGIARIRLSSIEHTDVPPGLLDLIATNEKICRHLHVPLQSGDDTVLRMMNRPYDSAEFLKFVEDARSIIPDIGITTDIMVGFPGETSEQFENTLRTTSLARFSRAHVFRYSPRPGTAAAALIDQVSSDEKELRRARLMELTSRQSCEFTQCLLGRTIPVLVERKEIRPNLKSGLTDNYVRVTFEADRSLAGKIVQVHIETASEGIVHGRLIDPS